ncbi:nagb/rpia/CoA transferase-like protein [Parathielavia appendiculata]|uniref:5-formyltetrahydrofolate cyclo-ligase n=1 Tax=Parathielavia appendiculata TaxID=2587402 RepID=A0AAN6Z5N2_9PEZI|nr:nagb/rpia/CoA transferase-like protein [Parathielavia appendiculata]
MSQTAEMNATAPLNVAKRNLRAALKLKLKDVSHNSILSQSSTVFKTLKTLDAYRSAKRISVFLSMPTGEIQTDAIVRDALRAGKDVFIPYLYKNPAAGPGLPARIMDMVRLRDVADYESLQPDKWGIPSIDPATIPERQRVLGDPDIQHSDSTLLDLVLMPGVAFDIEPDNGAVRRLGHGKGFYDYFLFRHRLKATSLGQQEFPALLLGLALSEQFLSPSEGPVPVGPLDQPLNGLVLGNGDIKGPLAAAPLNETD